MSLKMNPGHTRKNPVKGQGTSVSTPEPEVVVADAVDDERTGLIEAVRSDAFSSPNPFDRENEVIEIEPVLIMPTQVTSGTKSQEPAKKSKTTSTQQTKAGAGQTANQGTKASPKRKQQAKDDKRARLNKAIDRTENVLDFLERKYVDFGGDLEGVGEIREEALSEVEDGASKDGKDAAAKSRKATRGGQGSGQSRNADRGNGSKSDKDAKGGGKVASKKQKLTDEQKAQRRPISTKITNKVKPLPPSEVGPALEHIRIFVETCRKYGIPLKDQQDIVDSYNEYEAIREQEDKDANRNRKEEEEFAKVFGDI